MVMLFNDTDFFGMIFNTATVNVTGNLMFVLVLLVFVLLMICLAFRIPLEMALVFMLPLLFVLVGLSNAFSVILILALLFLTFILYTAMKFLFGG